jgi:galactokinase
MTSPTKHTTLNPLLSADESPVTATPVGPKLEETISHSLATLSILSQAHDLAELKREHPHFYQILRSETLKSDTLEASEKLNLAVGLTRAASTSGHSGLSQISTSEVSLEDFKPTQFTSLDQVYAQPNVQRLQLMKTQFQELFHKPPDYYTRSPARVNLLGEHLDYSGYPVVNVALDALDVCVAVALVPGGKKWEIANSSHGFDIANVRKVTLLPEQEGYFEFDPKKKDWLTYFKATLKASIEVLKIDPWHVKANSSSTSLLPETETTPRSATPRPAPASLTLQILIHGNIPSQAGLSSSAALCLAFALAITKAYTTFAFPKRTLLSIAIRAETSLGIYCSGMDHSISLLPMVRGPIVNHFSPERWSDAVVLPTEGWSIVVSNCGVVPDKTEFAPKSYNVRVLECRLASAVIENEINLALPSATKPTLRMLQDSFLEREDLSFEDFELETLDNMSDLVSERFSSIDPEGSKRGRGYTLDEVATELGMDLDTLKETYMGDLKVELGRDKEGSTRVAGKRLQLFKRAKHVYSEASRVYRFLHLAGPTTTIDDWIDLINDSQESCRVLYDISSVEVDSVVSVARKAGALASRLTGAGWGGCVVSLVRDSDLDSFVEALKRGMLVGIRIHCHL